MKRKTTSPETIVPTEEEQASALLAASREAREKAAAEDFQVLLQKHRVRIEFRQVWVNGQPGGCTIAFIAEG